METNIKCFIDGIKPTEKMNEDELRKFSDAARKEIKRLIDQQNHTAQERDALKAQLADANDRLALVSEERDKSTDEVCDNYEKIRELEKQVEEKKKSTSYWMDNYCNLKNEYDKLKEEIAAIATLAFKLAK